MKRSNSHSDNNDPEARSEDLARRLERYRTRVASEGRKRSLQVIDRAIKDIDIGSADR